MDKKVFVSEAEIAFWGCVFPSNDVRPKSVLLDTFLSKRVEIYVYDFPYDEDHLHFRSIEQNLAIGMGEEMSREALNRPAQLGYRMSSYSAFDRSKNEVQKYAHSALQFARCFKLPPKHRDKGAMGEGLMRIHTIHAERLQHMSGVRNMKTRDLKKALCDRKTYGVTFGHFVLQAYRKGIIQMPVEALRMWLAAAFAVDSVNTFMNINDYQEDRNLCIFCHVRVSGPASCTVKLGARWAEVQIRVDQVKEHTKEIDLAEIENEGISIVFEVGHVVRYHPSEMIQLHDIRLARIIRWFHRMLKCILFGLFGADPVYSDRVMRVLRRTIQNMKWEPQDCGVLYRHAEPSVLRSVVAVAC